MQTVCLKVRLKPGSVQRVREWAAELNRRGNDVLETLRDEGVVVESVFLDTDDGDCDCLIYYMKALDLEEARNVVRRSQHAIDAFHQQFKQETWESRTSLELLIDFENLGLTPRAERPARD
jgi:hypothetical protein